MKAIGAWHLFIYPLDGAVYLIRNRRSRSTCIKKETILMSIADPLHHFGTLLGFGGAMVTAGIMLRIGEEDEQQRRRGRIARFTCLAAWAGLLMLIISGSALTFNEPEARGVLLHIKHVLVAVIFIDALLIHFLFFPRYFKTIGGDGFKRNYATMRKVGALSVTCWIAIVVLSVLMKIG
jgi:hypothetical protein